jgi:hypothetical protein
MDLATLSSNCLKLVIKNCFSNTIEVYDFVIKTPLLQVNLDEDPPVTGEFSLRPPILD